MDQSGLGQPAGASASRAAEKAGSGSKLLLLWPTVRPCVAASRSAAHARAARCSSGIAGRQLVRLLPSSTPAPSAPPLDGLLARAAWPWALHARRQGAAAGAGFDGL